MGGLSKHMRVTLYTFFIGCIAIAGIPPFSGFFSKDEILAGAFSKNPLLYIIGLGGALLTAFYMFRLLSLTFFGSFRGTQEQLHHLHESPSPITIPLILLAILSATAGLFGIPEFMIPKAHWLEHYLEPVFAQSKALLSGHAMSHTTEWILTVVSSVLILLVSIFAYKKYSSYKVESPGETGFGRLLQNKWYVDELYHSLIVNPLKSFSVF
jgi:NADH-quinone oxidoreductase subunit L